MQRPGRERRPIGDKITVVTTNGVSGSTERGKCKAEIEAWKDEKCKTLQLSGFTLSKILLTDVSRHYLNHRDGNHQR